MQDEPAEEVGEAAIHDVEAADLGSHDIEHVDFVHFAVADVNEGWVIAAQVEQRIHLDGSFGLPEACPGKDAQAQINDGGIQRVYRLLQFPSKAVGGIELASGLDQADSEIP